MSVVSRRRHIVVVVSALMFALFVLGPLSSFFRGGNDSRCFEATSKLVQLQSQLTHAETLHLGYQNELSGLKQQLLIFMQMAQEHDGRRGDNRDSGGKPSAQMLGPGDSVLSGVSPLLYDLAYSYSSVVNFLPHIAGRPDALLPELHIAASTPRQDVSIVIGIPTLYRDQEDYLARTLDSLIANLPPTALTSMGGPGHGISLPGNKSSPSSVLIVVLLGDIDSSLRDKVAERVKAKYTNHIDSGLIELVAPKKSFYPDFSTITPSFGDPPDRVQWRTKQVLDFSYLMMLCRSRGVYYLQLEDDVISKPHFLDAIVNFISEQRSASWILLEFSSLGFIGKLFKTVDLYPIVQFFLNFHRDKPCDWLLDGYISAKFCSPEKDLKNCRSTKEQYRRLYKPSLFQHIGLYSSLKGKVQKLKDRNFGKAPAFVPHANNPSAILSTTLKTYQTYTLEKAYEGGGYFWALLPQANDTVTITLEPPVPLSGIKFVSGNVEHLSDKFLDTIIEIKFDPEHPSTVKFMAALKHINNPKGVVPSVTGEDFCALGAFDNNSGMAELNLKSLPWSNLPSISEVPVSVVRLRVLKESQSWVILSEIDLNVKT